LRGLWVVMVGIGGQPFPRTPPGGVGIQQVLQSPSDLASLLLQWPIPGPRWCG
jgi:hypothetical protein